MPGAAYMGAKIKQMAPHCHAPIHPAAPVPTPTPHPGQQLPLMIATIPTIMINNKPAAVMGTTSTPCIIPGCVPNGPGVVMKGSATVLFCGIPAARKDDPTLHAGCVAPIPSPNGKIMEGSSDVIIGG